MTMPKNLSSSVVVPGNNLPHLPKAEADKIFSGQEYIEK
jgi:hypothetical protein